MAILINDWNVLESEFEKDYYLRLRQFLAEEYRKGGIFPKPDEIFNALHYTSLANTKAVIIGQDPYHGKGQAHGLSFSVRPGTPIPPSLQNIYKELQTDIGCQAPPHGCLISWAKQGVMLLNSVLTVREGMAHSHQGLGWERLTDKIIEILNVRSQPVVFLLWGSHAQKKAAHIDTDRHAVIAAPHPSPLSAYRGFFGSRPFSKTNHWLSEWGISPIDWEIPAVTPNHSVETRSSRT